MRKVYTHFDPPEVVPQYNSGESDVDIALYMPTTKRIEQYIRSGERLEDTRRLMYHTDYLQNLEDDDFTDPLMYRGYDRVDLELLHKEAIEDILARRKQEFSTSPQGEAVSDVPPPVGPVGNSDENAKQVSEAVQKSVQ